MTRGKSMRRGGLLRGASRIGVVSLPEVKQSRDTSPGPLATEAPPAPRVSGRRRSAAGATHLRASTETWPRSPHPLPTPPPGESLFPAPRRLAAETSPGRREPGRPRPPEES